MFEIPGFLCGESIYRTILDNEGFFAALYYDGDAHLEEIAVYAMLFGEIAAVAPSAGDGPALMDAEQEMWHWPKS